MEKPNLEKIRRFSLASGIILITYYAALVEISSPLSLSVLGIPFKIKNPNYISIGVILCSFLSMLRFMFYGTLIKRAPYTIQRKLTLNKCADTHSDGTKTFINLLKGETYEYEIVCYSEEDYKTYYDELESVFPHIAHGNGVKGDTINDGTESNKFKVGYIHFNITRKTRILSFFLNVDYTAPIWLNAIAIIFALYRF